MKLSIKLSLVLLAVILITVIFQIFFSNRLVQDDDMLDYVSSPEVFLYTKTYQKFNCQPFSEIHAENLMVYIIKSDVYAVFYNKYCPDTKLKQEGNTLTLSSDGKSRRWDNKIFIFMPENPGKIVIESNSSNELTVRGFDGKNSICYFKGGYLNFHTDMASIDLQLNDTRLDLELEDNWSNNGTTQEAAFVEEIDRSNGTVIFTRKKVKTQEVNIKAVASNESKFEISQTNNYLVNLTLNLNNSSFDIADYSYSYPEVKEPSFKNIFISGKLSESYNYLRTFTSDADDNSTFYCDSLVIDVYGDADKSYSIELPRRLETKYTSIEKKENVSLTLH